MTKCAEEKSSRGSRTVSLSGVSEGLLKQTMCALSALAGHSSMQPEALQQSAWRNADEHLIAEGQVETTSMADRLGISGVWRGSDAPVG